MNRPSKVAVSVLILVLCAVRAAVAAVSTPEQRTARANELLKSWTAGAGAGCSAAVDLAGATVWSGVSGDADLEHSAHIIPTTPFNVGSVAKVVTALAVLLLEHDGKLALDDSIVDRLPDLPAVYRPVHIRHLLTHTSGVSDLQDLLQGLSGFRRDDEVRQEDVLRALRARRSLNFAPGTRVQYSNSNYVLLAEMVQKISGLSLPDFVRTRIFAPLAMNDSRLAAEHTMLIPGVANGYQHSEEAGWEIVPRTEDLLGPGNLYTTAADLLKLMRSQSQAPWPSIFAHLQAPATLSNGKPALDAVSRLAAHGVWLQTLAGQTLVGHSGSTHGTRAALYRVEETGAAVALLCNRNDVDPETDAMELLDVFTGSKWTSLWDEMKAAAPAEHAPADLQRFAGTYQLAGWGIGYRLIATADGLLFNKPGRKLVPLADGSFSITGAPDALLRLETAAEGARMLLWNPGSRLQDPPEIYTRISNDDHYSPTPEEIEARAGCYESPELGTSVELRPGDDKAIRLADPRGREIAFQALLPDVWRGGNQILQFDRGNGTAVRGFYRSTEIAWKVWYRRRPCVTTE